MKVKEIMSQNVGYVEPNATIVEVAKLMDKLDVGAIPVCRQDVPIGMVTDRDIISRNIAQGYDPKTTSVNDIMSSDLKKVSPETNIKDASHLMAMEQIRRIPVVENDKLVGILSLADIASDGRFDEETSKSISEISKPEKKEF